MSEIHIGGQTGRDVCLSLSSPAAGEDGVDFDEGWIAAEVAVSSGGFSGRNAGTLHRSTLEDFRQQVAAVAKTLEGRAEFRAIEGWLLLGLEGDGQGHIRVSGELSDDSGNDNRLSFSFEIDQTYLTGIIESLDAALS